MLYTLERGDVSLEAGRARLGHRRRWRDEWRGLIDQVRQDRFVQWNDPPRPGSVERTLAFVESVQERARRVVT